MRKQRIIDSSRIYKEMGKAKEMTSAVHDLLHEQAKQLYKELVINKKPKIRGR